MWCERVEQYMKIQHLKTWIKTYGLVNVVFRGFYTKAPIIPVANNDLLRRMNWQLKKQKNLTKYIKIVGEEKYKVEKNRKKIIWWLWFQGADQAPDIVKKCLESVKFYSKCMGYKVIELDLKNLHDYVNLPEKIWEKWQDGKIGHANFSDLCRIALLADYGGIWLDSTVYLTGMIENDILDSDIFMFKASFLDLSVTKISSWFMAAKYSHHPFMCSLRDSMVNYWMNNNHVSDYFVFHLMAAKLSEEEKGKKYYEEIPYYSNTYPQLLGRELMADINEKRIDKIFQMSNIHKLSYKNVKNARNNSVYQYVLERKIGDVVGDERKSKCCISNI